MSDYSDEKYKQQMAEQKTTYKAKRQANNESVEIIVDPPGMYEPTDDRRRRGMHRIAYRSYRQPDIFSFITAPMMEKNAEWTGALPTDGTENSFHQRLDWEKNAPRFLVQTPPPGEVEPWAEPAGMIDFWYDKRMYGKVELSQNPIYVSENFTLGVHEGDLKVMAINFVSHAWRAFEKEWARYWLQQSAAGGTIYNGGVFRPMTGGSLLLKSGWSSVHPLYHDHMTETFSLFQNWIMEENRYRKILNFKDWVRALMHYLDRFAPNQFLTRSAFILSKKCPRAVSGFEIMLASEDPNDDVLKKQIWLNDPNFEQWLIKLREFGFMIDFNCPWKVIANVNSQPMREFIRDYAVEGQWGSGGQAKSVKTLQNEARQLKREAGSVQPHGNSETITQRMLKEAAAKDAAALAAQTNNLDDMFKTCYYRADHTDILVLMNYILSWWNDYARAFPVQRTAVFQANEKGPANQTVIVEWSRHPIPYDGSANPSVENIKNPYSLLAGKSIYRRSGNVDTELLKKSSWDIWVDTFGSNFPAKFYLFVRAREAAVQWDQATFDKNVKMLSELQKNLDGKAALDYINDKTRRLPSPGGNPPLRTVEHTSKTYNVYETRERELAGRGKFMIKI